MTRILVTGASGFLGRPCAEILAKAGHQVIGLGRSGNAWRSDVDVLACDIFDRQAVHEAVHAANAECLIHFAWESDPASRWVSIANLDWIAATLELARIFAEAGGSRFVFVGSCAEYDWSLPILSETLTHLRPNTVYGAAKAATGIALTAAADALGLSFAWPRVFYCYGPGEPRGRLVCDLVAGLLAGDNIPCTDGEQERDYLHTTDVATALSLVATSTIEGPVNIGSGQAIAVKEIIRIVSDLVGNPHQIELGARARSIHDPQRLVADVSRLGTLGFRPQFDLGRGVRNAVQSLLEEDGRCARVA